MRRERRRATVAATRRPSPLAREARLGRSCSVRSPSLMRKVAPVTLSEAGSRRLRSKAIRACSQLGSDPELACPCAAAIERVSVGARPLPRAGSRLASRCSGQEPIRSASELSAQSAAVRAATAGRPRRARAGVRLRAEADQVCQLGDRLEVAEPAQAARARRRRGSRRPAGAGPGRPAPRSGRAQ